jgi:hypothetical protein
VKSLKCSLCLFAEAVTNVDDHLGEMFLEEKTPTVDDVKVRNPN